MSWATIELIVRRNNKPTVFELKGKPIKPCPFCGCASVHIVEVDKLVWCSCDLCGCEGPFRDTRLHAIGVWQDRANGDGQ